MSERGMENKDWFLLSAYLRVAAAAITRAMPTRNVTCWRVSAVNMELS